jgi:hypothetical protein
MIKTDGKLYLGRNPDSKEALLYDPDDLTTHAVVVGMTGSGKTGLCIDLLEEAALNNIPALMIDPKGDITNTLLHFPDLLPSDFQPWVNPDDARREGKTIEEAGKDAAAVWSKGLADWEIGRERIQALKSAANFAVYTPGSDAGIPVSILASLEAPKISWEDNTELLREKISSTVTAILGLVGMEDIDPVQSREHILLANIFEQAWSEGRDLDLGELILQTQTPPFEKLGVFNLDTFFPEKDRFELAMLLNNILAAPTFQAWIEGQPLDIEDLLYGSDGQIRHSVFYIAHLSDAERMFFVTLLYSAVESWMRTQKGTNSLRALVYFDEIFGYMPPISNPPSKQIMLRLLKQARAFGVGQVLVTQNPVDIDYKGLSNTGSWFIGKLQTERDKERLLDGLEGVAAGSMNRNEYDKIISGLGKRVFLLHNVHEKKPEIFYTRWAMNYLTGPLSRNQIPAANALVGAKYKPSKAVKSTTGGAKAVSQKTKTRSTTSTSKDQGATSATRPAVPSGIMEYFLPNNLSMVEAFKAARQPVPDTVKSQGLLYRPVILAQADIRYLQRKYNLDYDEKRTAIVSDPDRRGVVRWEEYLASPLDPGNMDTSPAPNARFSVLDAPLSDVKLMQSLERDFIDWVYRSSEVTVFANDSLKIYAGPPTTEGEFRTRLSDEARKQMDTEIKKTESTYKQKVQTIQKQLGREKRELAEDEAEHQSRKMEELGTGVENLLGLLAGSRNRRRVSTSLTKRRMTAQAKADVEESLDAIEELEADLAELAEEIENVINEIEGRWGSIAAEIDEISITPYKKDILMEIYGVAWMPYYVVEVGGSENNLPGYSRG